MRNKRDVIFLFGILVVLILIIIFSQIIKISRFTGKATALGNVSFFVTGIIPTPPPSSEGGPGGRRIDVDPFTGERSYRIYTQFDIKPASFLISSTIGSIENRQLTIENTGEVTQTFKIKSNIKLLEFSEDEATVRAGDRKTISFSVKTEEPGITAGKIEVSSEFGTREVPVILNLKSKGAEYSIKFTIPEEFAYVLAGDEILTRLEIKDVSGRVAVDYLIKDSNNKAVYSKTEAFDVEKNIIFDKTIKLLEDLKEGTYVIGVITNYNGNINTDSKIIKIVKKREIRLEEPTRIIPDRASTIFFLMIILIIVHLYFKRKKKF